MNKNDLNLSQDQMNSSNYCLHSELSREGGEETGAAEETGNICVSQMKSISILAEFSFTAHQRLFNLDVESRNSSGANRHPEEELLLLLLSSGSS